MQILSCFIKPSVLKSPMHQLIRVDPKDPLIHLPVTQIYGGVKFTKLLENTAALRDDENTNHMFDRIQTFFIQLAVQLQKRLPPNNQTLSEVCSLLDPKELVKSDTVSSGWFIKISQHHCRE